MRVLSIFVALIAVTMVACSPLTVEPTSSTVSTAVQLQESGGPSEPQEGEIVIPGSDLAATPLLSPSELKQVVTTYGNCLGEVADRAFIRFRAEPLYGVFMELGVYSDKTGQVSSQLDQHCMVKTNIDPLIQRYQVEHPIVPSDHQLILQLFDDCVSTSEELTGRLPQMATADDLNRTLATLFPQLAQPEGQLLLDCSEEALYGPGVDYATGTSSP